MIRSSGKVLAVIFAITIMGMAAVPVQAGLHPSYSIKAPVDTVPFYTGANYDPNIPKPNDFFKDPLGQWPHRFYEMLPYLSALDASSDRLTIEQHGTTHEGRPLLNLYFSSPENIKRIGDIRKGIDMLATPSKIKSAAQVDSLIANLPATAWMGYNIHGDEISCSDAAVLLAYHLAAARDEATLKILDNVFLILDPCENPDGRERFLSMLQTYKSHVPNYDNQAAQHGGVWPWGRANHYMFDLNRDWILLTQPETIGKTRTIVTWHPQMVVDAHEMGSNATYLFSPPRQPINYNTPDNVYKWFEIFNKDQSNAFDQHGWPYYAGEWNEQWYPGYGSAWPTFHGAVGILYEQAGVDGSLVKQRDDYVLTFHEAVNHQFTSSFANLKTTADNREELMRDYHQARKNIVEKGRKSGLQFLFVPDGDELKMQRFIRSIVGQGIEVQLASSEFTVSSCTDPYHNSHSSKKFPAGTFIVNTAQPQGAIAKAVLEFDLHLNYEFLKEERRELEKKGDTRLYEVSSWSVPLAYDIDAYYTNSSFSAQTELIKDVVVSDGQLVNPDAQFGFLVNMEGEKTFLALTRIFAHEFVVHAATKPFSIEGKDYERGSLLLRNRGNVKEMPEILGQIAKEVGITITGVNTGKPTKGSYLGASTFRLLAQPRIALVTGSPMSFTSVGSLWFAIDKELEIPHSLIMATELRGTNLSAYNVIVLPSSWGGMSEILSGGTKKKLERWVSAGGTLVCTGSAAEWAADSSAGISQVRLKRQALDLLDKYQTGLEREQRAEAPPVDTMAVWHPETVTPEEKKEEKKTKLDMKQLEDLDKWQRKFNPRGAILRADLDLEDWLAFGMKKSVPASVS
jgi:hypothetical protein